MLSYLINVFSILAPFWEVGVSIECTVNILIFIELVTHVATLDGKWFLSLVNKENISRTTILFMSKINKLPLTIIDLSAYLLEVSIKSNF